MQHLRWLLLIVLPRYSKVSWGACFLISCLHVLSILIKIFHETLSQIIIYHHTTKQFFPYLTWLVTCFWFQKMFSKNIICFRFLWKTYTKRCTSNYVISRVKGLSSPVLRDWSGALNFRVWFGKRYMAVKIPILILFGFYLLCWLNKHLFCVLSLW